GCSEFGLKALRAFANGFLCEPHDADRRNRIMVLFDVSEECGFKSRVGKFVHAKGTEERIRAHAGDEVRTTADESGLRTTEKFVSTIRNNVDASLKAVEDARFAGDANGMQIEKRTRPEVLHEGEVSAVGESDKLVEGGLFGESGDLEVGAMDAQQQACAV